MKPVPSATHHRSNEHALTSACVGSLHWTRRAGAPDEMLNAVLENPDAFLVDSARRFKSSRNVTVSRIPREGKTGWVLRRLNYGNSLHQLRDFFRPSRAQRAFQNGLRLEQTGVTTARVLAVCEVRRLGWPTRAYLLTEEIPAARTLAQLSQNAAPLPVGLEMRLADLLARLHNLALSHRDLKASNVLVDLLGQPCLIDLDGVRKIWFGHHSRAVADLARLAQDVADSSGVTLKHLIRFLRAYCHRRGDENWRSWWRQIERRLHPT